jgi:hypothetical protein
MPAPKQNNTDLEREQLTMRDGLDFRRLPHRLIRLKSPLGVDQMRREDSVDERRLAQPSLTYNTK